MTRDEKFMDLAIELSARAVLHGNQPFGAVLVKDGKVVFTNENQIYTANDPSFHAEMGLMRLFCAQSGVGDLREYTLYSSCEPCFMCSGAMVWFRLGRLVYAASNNDLCEILGQQKCECSSLVFENSHWKPKVISGVGREKALAELRAINN